MSQQWYYSKDGQRQGPVAAEKLKELAAMEKNLSTPPTSGEVETLLKYLNINRPILEKLIAANEALDALMRSGLRFCEKLAVIEAMKPESQGLEETLAKIELLTKAIGLNAKCERAYFYRAMLQKRLGNEDKAYKDFQKSVELNPRNVDSQREIRLFEMRSKAPAA